MTYSNQTSPAVSPVQRQSATLIAQIRHALSALFLGSNLHILFRKTLLFIWVFALPANAIHAQSPTAWPEVEQAARGQTVRFNTRTGDAAIDRYLAWAAQEIKNQYGVTLVHVKADDISKPVSAVLAEREAGRTAGGSIDLLWIDDANLEKLKQSNLLYGSWIDTLPNSKLLDRQPNSAVLVDRLAAPWGTELFTLFYDTWGVVDPPNDPQALLGWIIAHPRRFTYPEPPNPAGVSFLKQLLLLLTSNPTRLSQPVGKDFETVTSPLWSWLDKAHPQMWRSGWTFPRDTAAHHKLLGDGDVDWILALNPTEVARAVHAGDLPNSIRGLQFTGGTLVNTHFLAIPFNSSATEGARVVINFLLSPEAQARKADETWWGDATVLAVKNLPASQSALFEPSARPSEISATPRRLLKQPHPSWTQALERAWVERYADR